MVPWIYPPIGSKSDNTRKYLLVYIRCLSVFSIFGPYFRLDNNGLKKEGSRKCCWVSVLDLSPKRIQDPGSGSHIASIEGCVIVSSHHIITSKTVFLWSAEHRANYFLSSITKLNLMWNIATFGKDVGTSKREPLSSTCDIVFNTTVIPVKLAATFSEHISLICEIRRSKVLAIVNHLLSASFLMVRTK